MFNDSTLFSNKSIDKLRGFAAKFFEFGDDFIRVNTAMLEFCWTLRRDINLKRAERRWGSGFFNQLNLELRNAFPDSTGSPTSNLKYMKRWYAFYYERVEIRHQVGDQLQRYVNREDEHLIRHQVTATDNLLRGEGDNPSVGLIICKTAKKTIVEWSLKDIDKPLGVATYQLQEIVDRTVKEIEQGKESPNTTNRTA